MNALNKIVQKSNDLPSKAISNITTLQQIQFLHRQTDGFITLFQKRPDGKQRQYHYKLSELTPDMLNNDGWIDYDTFISMNSFYIPKRALNNLRNIQCCFVDIDCYKRGYSAEETIKELEEKHFGQTIPKPNLVIYSGQGLQLVWTITFMSGLAIGRWNDLQQALATPLKYLGADFGALDASRVFRLVGTFNSKLIEKGISQSESIVTADLLHGEELSFHQITEQFFPSIYRKSIKEISDVQRSRTTGKKNGAAKKGVKGSVKFLFTPYSLMAKRLDDLFKLAKMRGPKAEGCREYMLFLCRYFALQLHNDKDLAIQKMEALNSLFEHGLNQSEMLHATKSAEIYHANGGILLKNETIINWLQITEQEQQELSTIFMRAEKNRRKALKTRKARHENGMQSMAQYNRKRKLAMVRTLKRCYLLKAQYPNLSLSQYASKLGVVKSTISKYFKLLTKSFSDLCALVMSEVTQRVELVNNSVMLNPNSSKVTFNLAALEVAYEKDEGLSTEKDKKLIAEFEYLLKEVAF